MANLHLAKWHRQLFWVLGLTVFLTAHAYAATTGNLPFNSSMETFKANFMAWLFAAAVVMWVATCLMLAFGEWGSGIKAVINIIFWLSLAFSGASGATLIFGVGAIF